MNWNNMQGKWALVTGASAGIGKAFAQELAARKINLILVARREKDLNELADSLKKEYGIEAMVAPVDLSKDGFLDDLVRLTGDKPVDVLVNNAGFGTSGFFWDIEGRQEESMIKVNCLAPVILTRHYLKSMKQLNQGSIIFLSSIASNQPSPTGTTYAATKVFDLFLGEGLHYELKNTNINVLTVLPGATATEFQKVAKYNKIKGARSPKQVVITSLKNLGKKRSVSDGISNKIMGFAARMLPRALAIHLAYKWTEGRRNKDA
jgi:short-subunit dehydrogenase